jgi:hypothetical protein
MRIGFKSWVLLFKKTVDLDTDAEALRLSGFLRMSNQTFGGRRWYLVQDGAICHTATSTLEALFEVWNIFPQ